MDFLFTTEADEAAALAASILADLTTNERQRTVEAGGSRFDSDLWSALGSAGLLSVHLPEAYGGAGLGLIELCRVLVEVGRTVGPVPLATHAACGLLLAEAASDAVRTAWLPGVASGSTVLAAAVSEEHAWLPTVPLVAASTDGPGATGPWTLSGAKTLVRAGMTADGLLTNAVLPDGSARVFLVESTAAGVQREVQHTSDGDATALVTFTAAPAVLVGDGDTAERFGQLLAVTTSAELLGITEGALALTAAYAKTREQFKRPIATFQAVSQRLADGFIDVLAQRLTLWQAAWRLAEGLPAATEVAVAKLWAADAAHRLAHTTVHIHGGVGIDLDGEAHRYFTAAKRFEFAYGASTEQALRIGAALASA